LTRVGNIRIILNMTDAEITETPENGNESIGSNGDDSRKYERSSIAFPYGSLKDAEEIARSLHTKWGDSAEIDQLAGGLQTTRGSGAFRAKIATARTFGVIDSRRGRLSLTALGKQLIDPKTAAAARVTAFLRVPLFKVLYEQHKSGVIPPDTALENEIRELGVSSRQTDRARQAFQRSAEQAGFFAHGRDRLIEPNVAKLSSDSGSAKDQGSSDQGEKLGVVNRSDVQTQAMDLLTILLSDDAANWSDEKIAELVRAARTVQSLFK
jgi:hypothetical protein